MGHHIAFREKRKKINGTWIMMKRLMAVLLAFVLLPLCCCAAATDIALPSRYDMREKGIVTPVKLQYPWGSCWI